MGREKARLRLGKLSLLGHIRRTASSLGLPVRIIGRDLMAKCGPLGGIYTALKTSRADAELFLACDMPFVSAALLERLVRSMGRRRGPVFVVSDDGMGFPFLLPADLLSVVEQQIKAGRYSIQALVGVLPAKLMRLPRQQAAELFNVNTEAEWETARAMFNQRSSRAEANHVARILSRSPRAGKNPGKRPL